MNSAARIYRKPSVFFLVVYALFMEFVPFFFLPSYILDGSFFDAGGLMKWVRPLKKRNLYSSKLKRTNLRLMSLQMCHPFLVGQGEYRVSGLGVYGKLEKMFSV